MSRQALHSALATAMMLLTVLSVRPAKAQSTSDRDHVLAANTEFYRAFRASDMPAMEAVWGEAELIAVEHLSSWREEGREAVLASWATLLRSPPAVACHVEALAFDQGRATVFCNENLNPGNVRMINIFHREGEHWKMIYHGPAPETVTS